MKESMESRCDHALSSLPPQSQSYFSDIYLYKGKEDLVWVWNPNVLV